LDKTTCEALYTTLPLYLFMHSSL